MNNETIAENLINRRFGNYIDGLATHLQQDIKLLKVEFEQALDKAAGIEPEFEFGDRVLVGDGDGERKAIFINYTGDTCAPFCALEEDDEHVDMLTYQICIPDPAHSHPLHFVAYDYSEDVPVRTDQNIIAFYENSKDNGCYYGKARNAAWAYIKRYAVVTEDFLK